MKNLWTYGGKIFLSLIILGIMGYVTEWGLFGMNVPDTLVVVVSIITLFLTGLLGLTALTLIWDKDAKYLGQKLRESVETAFRVNFSEEK
jgi:hypothetical protein